MFIQIHAIYIQMYQTQNRSLKFALIFAFEAVTIGKMLIYCKDQNSGLASHTSL